MRAMFEGRIREGVVTGRLEKGDVLPDALLDVCREHGVRAGWLFAIGAVSSISITAYAQKGQRYLENVEASGDIEVLSLAGNVSLLDGEPFLHLHVVAAKEEDGQMQPIAGHLVRAEVFALEFLILPVSGVALERSYDELTGLKLWRR